MGLPSVYPSDTPLRGLCTAELLPVMTLRLFALPWYEADDSHPDWRDGLIAADIGAVGVPAFEALFMLVATSARRPLDVRRRCPALGDDEGLLLRLISLLQSRQLVDAAEILLDWLPLAAARAALLPASRLATAMKSKDLIVPLRHPEAALWQQASLGCRDRGLALVQ